MYVCTVASISIVCLIVVKLETRSEASVSNKSSMDPPVVDATPFFRPHPDPSANDVRKDSLADCPTNFAIGIELALCYTMDGWMV